ncbi:MAG: hypothetical protein LBV43_11645 [Prevotella sp.]|jgi:hypothetical protein|nr:hypothetical protein [Prevotella sp.]
MKSIFILIMMICSLSLAAQNEKFWIDIFIKDTYPLNKWSNDEYLENYLKTNTRNIAFRFSTLVSKKWGIWGELSLKTYSKSKRYLDEQKPYLSEYDPEKYYVSVEDSKGDRFTDFSVGGFYYYRYRNWAFSPIAGFGFESLRPQYVKYTAKEKDSNTKMLIYYNRNDEPYLERPDEQLVPFAYMGGTASFIIPKSPLRISLGIGFRQYLKTLTVTREVRNYYNNAIIEKTNYKGQLASEICVEIGIIGWIF